MKAFGMEASVFSAVGDLEFLRKSLSSVSIPQSVDTMSQLKRAKRFVKWGRVKLVLKSADVPTYLKPGDLPGAILGIEGGDDLNGNLNKVDEFYRAGVRVITLMHYGINEIGENTFIFEANVIQPFVKIGNNTVLWSGNHVGHDVTIGDNVFIASHAVISGNVTIGDNCFVGVNATFVNDIAIAPYTLVGAGAFITQNTKTRGAYIGARAEKSKRESSEFKL